jgi:hypothetical protein
VLGVRAGVRLARTDGQHLADRAGLDHVARAHHVGREHLGLGVAVHDAGLADDPHDLCRLVPGARERLRAHDRLAGRGGDADRIEVQVVGEPDDDELDLGIRAEVGDLGVLRRDAVAGPERRGTLGAARVVRHGTRAGNLVEAGHVEVGDEAGPDQADLDGTGVGISHQAL